MNKHIKMPQSQYTDKIVDVSVSDMFLRLSLRTERVGEGDPTSEFGVGPAKIITDVSR